MSGITGLDFSWVASISTPRYGVLISSAVGVAPTLTKAARAASKAVQVMQKEYGYGSAIVTVHIQQPRVRP